jgi:hypothetical protein
MTIWEDYEPKTQDQADILAYCKLDPETVDYAAKGFLVRRGFRSHQSCLDLIPARTQTSRDSMTLGRLHGKKGRSCLQRPRRCPEARFPDLEASQTADFRAFLVQNSILLHRL